MNSSVTFPPRPPALKLTRSSITQPPEEKWIPLLAEERRKLEEDHEALRLREENLRDYEARLRALQAEIDARRESEPAPVRAAVPFARPTSRAPFESDPALQAAWEKLHRAQELFESERVHLRDERIVTHEREAQLKRREHALAERERRIAEREAALVAATALVMSEEPVAAEHTMSAVTRLTRAPFDMARSVFSSKKTKPV